MSRPRRSALAATALCVVTALPACSSSAPSHDSSGPAEAGGNGAEAGSPDASASPNDTGDAAVDAKTTGHDGSSGKDAGATPADASAGVDSATSEVDASGSEASEDGNATGSGGQGCTDPDCGCVGYHQCATGCCAFTGTTLVASGSGYGVDQLGIAVAADGTIHAGFQSVGGLYHASNPGGNVEIDPVIGGTESIPTGIALDSTGNPSVSYWSASYPWIFGVMTWNGTGWTSSYVGESDPVDDVFPLTSMSLGYDPAGNLHLFSYEGSESPILTSLNGGPGPTFAWTTEYTASNGTTEGFSSYGFDPDGSPFVSMWSLQAPAQVQLQRYQAGTWVTSTFPASAVSASSLLLGSVDPAGDATFLYTGYDVFSAAGETAETLPTITGVRYYQSMVTAPNGNVAFLADGGLGTTEYVVARISGNWLVGTVGTIGNPGTHALAMGSDGLPVACWTPPLQPNFSQALLCSKW